MLKNIIKKIINNFSYKITRIKKSDVQPKNIKNSYKKLLKNYKNHKILKLHFGCGPRVLKGWVNIDLYYTHYEDYMKYYTNKFYDESVRGDENDFYAINILKTGLPLPDNSVDIIFHEDFLEHLNQKEQIVFLAETFRILKKGCTHRVNTPDLLTSMLKNSDFIKGKNGVYFGEWEKHKHLNVLTTKTLEEMAKMVGYRKISFNSRDKSLSKEIPLEYRPGEDRGDNDNIFADLIK